MMVSPKGREGTYSALASAPLFTAKFFVGGLSGVLLGKYCTGIPAWPDPMSCEHGATVWMIIGLVCITSPIGLYLCDRCIRQPYINDDTGLEGTLTLLVGSGSYMSLELSERFRIADSAAGSSGLSTSKGQRGYAQISRESSALVRPEYRICELVFGFSGSALHMMIVLAYCTAGRRRRDEPRWWRGEVIVDKRPSQQASARVRSLPGKGPGKALISGLVKQSSI